MAVFTAGMNNLTIVADATLVIIHTEATASTAGSQIRLIRAWCNQLSAETSQQLGIIFGQKASAFGTYTAVTPWPHFIGGPASAIVGGTAGAEGTAGIDASAEGAGAVTTGIEEGFNNLNGWSWIAVPEERIIVPADTAVILKMDGTPTSLDNWCAGITYEEIIG